MTKRVFKSNLTCCALLLSVFGTAHAATYYVSTAGSDFNPGTQTAPFRHLSRGAIAAHAGDTVIVMNGTYDNEGQVAQSNGSGSVVRVTNTGTAGSPITFRAQNRGGAILDAANVSGSTGPYACNAAWAYFDVSYTAYVVIQGFVIQHGCFNGIRANGHAHDITIKWNEIRNIGNWSSGGATLSSTGIYLNKSEYNFTFDGNIFHDIGGGPIVNQEHAIYTSASNVTIINNVFYNQVHGWDIQTAGGRNLFIANNTFAFPNPNRDGHIILWDEGITNSLSNIVIRNNVFYKPRNYAVVTELDGGGSISGCTNQNNLTTVGSIYDNRSSCILVNNLTNTDPSFVNPVSPPYDFHLQSGSRAIDSGMTASYTRVDFEDWARPVDGIYDRGAFEYHLPDVLSLPLLQIHADALEVSGVTNGSTVTPAVAPLGFKGTVVVKGTGSIVYTSALVGGVYFLNCCTNSNNAYYKFTGTTVGSIFNMNHGQISFSLKSRHSFAQRKALAVSRRYTFDVSDGNGRHLFNFLTQITSGSLYFNYIAAGTGQYYRVAPGTEDAMFGSGAILKVRLAWDGAAMKLYLNGTLVKSSPYTAATANWTSASNFDLGAYEYQTFGGYNVSDDVIDEFTVQ